MPLAGIGFWDGNLVEYHYFGSVANSQSNLAVRRTPNGTANIPDYVAQGDGWIVGVAVEADRADAVTGTGTFVAAVNGNGVPVSCVVSAAAGTWRAKSNPATKFQARFRAGDTIGLLATTDAGWPNPQAVLCRVLIGYDRCCAGF